MTQTRELQSLSDDELLRRLSDLLSRSRRVESDLIAHIAEVDERRLYIREACSMFGYCTEVLHLSDHEAYVRITAARASRKYPTLLELLRDGQIHLSGIGKLASHLTAENYETLLARACHQSKRQIEELLVEISPKPDVPAVVRILPDRAPEQPSLATVSQLVPDRVTLLHTSEAIPPPVTPKQPARAVLEPLAPSRFKVQFTASGELREKLPPSPYGLRRGFDEALAKSNERLEAKRYAETKAPRKTLAETDTSPRSRYIPAAVRRAVRKRDGDRCRFVSEQGRRCTELRGLEFHHHDPFGRGGDHDPDNVSLMCKQHNAYRAERDYGKDVFERYRGGGGRVSECGPVYGFLNDDRAPLLTHGPCLYEDLDGALKFLSKAFGFRKVICGTSLKR